MTRRGSGVRVPHGPPRLTCCFAGLLCILGGARNAAGSHSGSQTVLSRNKASAASLITDSDLQHSGANSSQLTPVRIYTEGVRDTPPPPQGRG